MGKRKRKRQKREAHSPALAAWVIGGGDGIAVPGYTALDRNPEVMTACRRIAELVGSITVHIMENTGHGDERVINGLSRKIDIEPDPYMTRKTWMEAVVMNLLLYGKGNSVVWPHTRGGLLESLEPVAACRVSFEHNGYRDYRILVDGVPHDPRSMLHFTHNPDSTYLWKGRGLTVSLRDVADALKQAAATEKGFMESKWKPSLVVKVDAMQEEFSSVAGRKRLMEEYLATSEAGEPWIVPADLVDVKEVRPLSLSDIAISDVVQTDKRTVASILGVPPFVLGVGEYSKEAWNNFVQNTVRSICTGIAQELTRKLVLNPKWYVKFNTLSLLDWDIGQVFEVYGGLSDRGFVTGNEVRDRIGMSPLDGLDELRILENYLPFDMSGKQKKLVQE